MRAAETTGERVGRLLGAVAPFVGVIVLAILTVVDLARGVDDFGESLLGTFDPVPDRRPGVRVRHGHMLMPARVAEGIGWPAHPQFQWEVGLANLSYGVLGVVASSYGHNSWSATIIAYSVFMLGAAADTCARW